MQRAVAPQGRFMLSSDAPVHESWQSDAVVAGAVQSPADQRTESALVNLPGTDEVVRRR